MLMTVSTHYRITMTMIASSTIPPKTIFRDSFHQMKTTMLFSVQVKWLDRRVSHKKSIRESCGII